MFNLKDGWIPQSNIQRLYNCMTRKWDKFNSVIVFDNKNIVKQIVK